MASYNNSIAVQYRRDRSLHEAGMAVLIQQQVQGVYSGVAFTRDPMTKQGDAVVIEALPGNAAQLPNLNHPLLWTGVSHKYTYKH